MMKLLDRAEARRPSSKVGEHTTTGLRPWLVAWLGRPVLGVANGAIRDATYKRATGELAAHQLSTATLLALMAAYLWALEGRWPIGTSREAFTIGGSWAVLTVLFEFGFGHYVTGDAWSSLLRAYNLADGRVWAAVPLWPLVGPELFRRLRARR
jgi:hypothetical protein